MLKRLVYISCVFLFTACSDGEVKKPTLPITENEEEVENAFQDNTLLKQDIAAYKTVVNVIRETGLAQNFVILPGKVKEVEAYIKNNERILEYNPEFMQKLETDTNWHGISVLAREIGHHLSNHALTGGTASIEEELEADKYAGFVLHKMGASLEQAIAAMENSMAENSNASASLNARIASLTKGWTNSKLLDSDTLIASNTDPGSAVPNVPDVESPTPKPKKPATRKPNYSYQIFLAVDTSFYFINDQNIVFSDENNNRVKVGEKKESNKPGFDWIFVKEDASYGVDIKGRLWAFSLDGNFHIVGQAIKLN